MKNSDFITGAVPITKEEVRAIALNKLELKNKKRFLDVGAGTGSISIEAAATYDQLEVIAIEHYDEAIRLIQNNKEKFELKNIKVIQGRAPIELPGKADAIFIGGSDGSLKEIIEWSYDLLNEGGSLVANFLLLDNFYEALHLLKESPFVNVEATMLSICKLQTLGKGEYFKPFNPIYLLSCNKERKNYE
ncbi:decarboxylating cobalt-precorrin-6B (C(15))-methyltransferase [Cellulosilyticum sp. I15G10I2]|uniref:decarboxylating cobalt-precorrin-6B (C(15))-methyltransferase n=1 Tax=Cellulosilyticum sp. I15G10I2 TaxID=1892843 RepID=UPI00085C7432|nr:decarboxylating cobalt-precorrin-6B (C(15))-methyltransferase [Cellulosilyticum sp. I15G10I2]